MMAASALRTRGDYELFLYALTDQFPSIRPPRPRFSSAVD